MLIPLILPLEQDVVVYGRTEVRVDDRVRAVREVDGLFGCLVSAFVSSDSHMAGNPAEYYVDMVGDGVDGLEYVEGHLALRPTRITIPVRVGHPGELPGSV